MTHSSSKSDISCEFCHLLKHDFKFILHQDEEFFVVEDIHPDFELHYQVITKKHIESIASLTKADKSLVERMKAFGESFLINKAKEKSISSLRYGYHVPPYTSIDHLHMHCIGGRQIWSFYMAAFAPVDSVIRKLGELDEGTKPSPSLFLESRL
eukprot:TRINITY_DN3547_c0_g1_i1.p1 TRINITY_DN3547_c0_g1~~TRINITY_DN3547_c0_g1_i1.p1  ORF type:complete len:154 (+),score=22.23 TRINITY_DN3547_c0_g1_i1:3-464(+)